MEIRPSGSAKHKKSKPFNGSVHKIMVNSNKAKEPADSADAL
jgi:hypothetical protein